MMIKRFKKRKNEKWKDPQGKKNIGGVKKTMTTQNEATPIKLTEVYPELIQMQTQLQNYITHHQKPTTTKEQNQDLIYHDPPVDPHLTRFIVHKSADVRKVSEVYTKDIVLNDYTLSEVENTTDTTKINDVLNNPENKIELYYAQLHVNQYGYGACELIEPLRGYKYRFQQIPSYTLRIRRILLYDEQHNTYTYNFAEQTVNGQHTLLKILGENYTGLEEHAPRDLLTQIDYWNLHECIWFGGGPEDEFYNIPLWESCSEKIYTNIAINQLNLKKINKGNIPAGVMLFTGPMQLPDPQHPEEKRIDDKLNDGLIENDGDTIFAYITVDNEGRGVDMKYQVLADNNYEYLQDLEDDNMKAIYKLYSVPPERMMLMDTKESMNSNKSEKVLETYSNNVLKNDQIFYKKDLELFCRLRLGINSPLLISLPEFVDNSSVKLHDAIDGFNNGVYTLGQTLSLISEINPQLDILADIDEDDEILDMRFYNGGLLGEGDTRERLDDVDTYDSIVDELNSLIQ